MNERKDEGKIVTFYSFKGGVGRTMALANVAFLAALNRQRVLVIDWDLEAPGLAYYFRGLLDAPDGRALKEAPGVLDILWDWSCSIKEGGANLELADLQKRFEQGQPFQDCVRPLMVSEYVPHGIILDFIGAGSRNIRTPESRPYEEALARFSWPDFFDNQAGGFVLDSLRRWAKSKYDLVLLDSRTGLADVAGICTMQMPDIVALCFILNRQNIDGITKVAAAIRTQRKEAVKLRAIPMRVARSDTPEESDAKARAILELTRIGGFSSDAVQEDFRVLSVAAADNVPFYETLAPFTAQDPSLDVLTLNYLRLATQLFRKPFEIPSFDPDLMEQVRRRLVPRHATVEYVAKLKSAEPARAVAELQRLIESALDTEMDGGGLDDDYVAALVDAALVTIDLSESPFNATDMQGRTLDLLRALTSGNPEKWRPILISAIERYLDMLGFVLDSEEEHALLEELDGLLALSPTVSNRLKRISHRRATAHLYVSTSNMEVAMQTVGEIITLVKEMIREGISLTSDQMDEILAAEVDVLIMRGDIYRRTEKVRAQKEYEAGLAKLIHLAPAAARNELSRLRYELHRRLSQVLSDEGSNLAAAQHAVEAVRWARVASHFQELASSVLRMPNKPELALAFCEGAFASQENRSPLQVTSYYAGFYGRQPQSATEFLSIVGKLSGIIGPLRNNRSNMVLRLFGEIIELVLRNVLRRRTTVGARKAEELSQRISDVIAIWKDAGLPLDKLADLEKSYNALRLRHPRRDLPAAR